MSGFQIPQPGQIRLSKGKPPTPVVPRERVDLRLRSERARAEAARREKKERDRLAEAALASATRYKQYRARKRKRIEAFAQEVAELFPPGPSGHRSQWPLLATIFIRNPYMSLNWYARRAKMGHHTTVLHALRQMGLYETRETPEFREKQRRALAARAREAECERGRKRPEKEAKRRARAELEAKLQDRGEFILNTQACLSVAQVREIKALLVAGEKPDAIGARYGVQGQTIRCIRANKTWTRVPWPAPAGAQA